MSAKRYEERKINKKKVYGVIIAIIAIVLFIVTTIKLLKYEPVQTTKASKQTYNVCFENNKWGVIDEKGDYVIKPEYDEMITIPNPNYDVFIITTNVDAMNETYQTKVVNKNNEEIYNKYQGIEALVNTKENGEQYYEQSVLIQKNDNKYGLIAIDGKELLKPQYDNISAIENVKDYYLVEKDGLKGVSDNKGNIILSISYTDIKVLNNKTTDGFIVKNAEEKYGIVKDNLDFIPCKYDNIQNISGYDKYVVKEDGSWKIINQAGDTIVNTAFTSVKEINETNTIIENNNKVGVVDNNGKTIIPTEFKDISYAFDNYYIAKKADKYGVIDQDKNNKIEYKYKKISYNKQLNGFICENTNYNSDIINSNFEKSLTGIITDIQDEYLRIRENGEYKYYNYKLEEISNQIALKNNTIFLSKENNKYGFIDKNGVVVANYEYDDAFEQNEFGYSAIKKDGLWGALDKTGNIVVEPKYDLENNIKIDFIGTWHLAEDAGSNYYIK